MKECPNKLGLRHLHPNNEKCEHCDVDGHDIDHFYSLHPKFHPNKSTNNKDDGGKGGCRGSNGFQTKGKATNKVSSKANNQGQGDGMATTQD
jgi:hypothetical protein